MPRLTSAARCMFIGVAPGSDFILHRGRLAPPHATEVGLQGVRRVPVGLEQPHGDVDGALDALARRAAAALRGRGGQGETVTRMALPRGRPLKRTEGRPAPWVRN